MSRRAFIKKTASPQFGLKPAFGWLGCQYDFSFSQSLPKVAASGLKSDFRQLANLGWMKWNNG